MTNPEVNCMGTKRWYNDKGEWNRLDGPAIEFRNGTKEWWINGYLVMILGADGSTSKAKKDTMNNIPSEMKQSIITEILKGENNDT
jgi:hypothetical protein